MGPDINELSKEYYLVQIRDLENRLARYQKKCDELEVSNGQFHDKFDQMATDKKEIVAFWKKQVEQRTDDIADLNDRLIGLQQAKDAEKEQYEGELQKLRNEFQETKDQLTSENMILNGKLASLEEFKVQKEDLMNKFAMMEAELAQNEQDHKDEIYRLERKQVIDKDMLKKEMVNRVNQVASEFRKVSNKQMAETTKRTIRDNVSITAQLDKMSDKTTELISENDELRKKNKEQRQKIEMLEDNEKEILKKNHSNQKIIKMLTEKCRNQEAMIEEFELREQEFQEVVSETEMLRTQNESMKEEIERINKDNDNLEFELRTETDKSQQEVKNRKKLERVLGDAANALKTALRKTSPDEPDDSTMNDVERRDNMLEYLLILLNSAAAIGVGPQPGEIGKQFKVRQKSAGEMPGKQGIKRGDLPVVSGPGTLPHYQLGDLGLIPRPKQPIPTSMDKMRVLSATTRLGGLRKVLCRSVGVQTVSAPKAMFYADQLLSRAPHSTQDAVLHELQPPERSRASPLLLGPITPTKKMMGKVM